MEGERIFKIVEKTKIWFAISIVIVAICLGSLFVRGLNFGIDFVGGTVVTINMEKSFDVDKVRNVVSKYDKTAQVQAIEGNTVSIRSNSLTDDSAKKLFQDVKKEFSLKVNQPEESNRIGPSVGKDLTRKAIVSSIVAIAGILIYISIRFQWKFGVAVIVSILHDLIITVGVFSLFQIQVNSSFMAAVLAILGYSINDSIVVFDRVRENERRKKYSNNVELGNASLTQTMARSINTVFTVLIVVVTLYIIGVPAVKEFTLPIIIGLVFGGYSSIFIAVPAWVKLASNNKKKVTSKARN